MTARPAARAGPNRRFGLELEDPHRVAAAHRLALRLRQRVDAAEAAFHVADIVRVVRAVHHLVGAADLDAEIERFLALGYRVVLDAAELLRRLPVDLDAAGVHGLSADGAAGD